MSWLPNFSVEVTHINNLLRADVVPQTTPVTHTSQIRSLARQVQQMFPRYPMSVIVADLQITRSLELTVDNILEGRLVIPPHYQEDEEFELVPGSPGNNSSTSPNGDNNREGPSSSSASDYYVSPRYDQFTDSSSSSTPSRESTPNTPGFESGYEIERNSNIFGNQNDLLRESSDEVALGDRFSKSSSEREKILARRKELMIAQARQR